MKYKSITTDKNVEEIKKSIHHVKFGGSNDKIAGIGDLVEKTLKATGIKQIYQKTRKALGKDPNCRSCEENRKAMNESKWSKKLFKKD